MNMSFDYMTLIAFTFFWSLTAPFIINSAVYWLPVVGEIRKVPMHFPGQRPAIFIGILTIAFVGGVRAYFMGDYPISVCFQIVGLTLALILALLDWQDKWLPAYVTVPMLLTGLVNAQIIGAVEPSVYGATLFWVGISTTMVIHSLVARRNFMSGGDMTMAAACGAWLGYDRFALFIGTVGALHVGLCLVARRIAEHQHLTIAQEGLPLGPSLALATAGLVLIH